MASKFARNLHGKSTYTCVCCGHQTRETGLGEQGCELCAFCFEVAGWENSHSDGNITDEEFIALIADLVKQYGSKAHADCVTLASGS